MDLEYILYSYGKINKCGKTVMVVKLCGKKIGNIKYVKGGYQYFPIGWKIGGNIFETIAKVQESLEDKE